MSGVSVSFCGDEVEFEEAVDKVYKEIQTFVNDTQCGVRELALIEERGETYMVALDVWHDLDVAIDGVLFLFKELRSISKQYLGKPPKELKNEVKAKIEDWKKRAALSKASAKAEAEEKKQN